MVSLHDIAKRCGVSTATVSAALNGKIQGVRRDARARAEQIVAVAQELGYRPQAAARSLRTQRTGVVGVLLMNHSGPGGEAIHPHQYELVIGATNALCAAGLGSMLIPMDRIGGDEHRVFQQQMLDGLIAFGHLSDEVEQRAVSLGVPVVWADSHRLDAHNCVHRDEAQAGADGVALAAAQGYRHLVRIGPPQQDARWWRERDIGIVAAADRLGVTLSRREQGADTCEAAEVLQAALGSHGALLCENAYVLHGLLAAVAASKLALGCDVPCVALDDSATINRSAPGVSRVRFNRHRLGQRAVAMLLAALGDEPQASQVIPDTIVAGTTLPALT
ncbi:MAG: LacI family DNA-binding transcriptional regulator [Planctomycetota bacterium]|jgi:DNA-binding LacI/PurR family transcriptional regulator|nr:LacI family DNA-binding transcriptional regulator [Planctomycetota bacterium]